MVLIQLNKFFVKYFFEMMIGMKDQRLRRLVFGVECLDYKTACMYVPSQ